MKTLSPLNETAKCPKCGYDDVKMLYSETGKYCKAEGITWRAGEHLCRVCQRCHYAWAEACIDPLATTPADRGGGEG